MKKLSFCAIVLSVLAIATVSCKKDNGNNPNDVPVDFYLLGTESGEMLVYKNDAVLYRSGNAGIFEAKAVDYEKVGNDVNVFSCGSVTLADVKKPAIWKNSEMSYPLGEESGCFNDIRIINGGVYAVGAVFKNGVSQGVLLRNNEVIFNGGDNTEFNCLDYGESGDFYVAGTDANGVFLWRISNSTTPQIVTSFTVEKSRLGSAESVTVKDLYVGTTDISLALTTVLSDGTTRAWWWMPKRYDTLKCMFSGQSEALATAISFGRCWIGGALKTGGNLRAVIWQDWSGNVDMGYDTNPGDSRVEAIKFGGLNNYELVSSPAQIQFCRNGELRLKLIVSSNFTPADFAVVRK